MCVAEIWQSNKSPATAHRGASLQVWHLQLDRSVVIPTSVAPATGQVTYYPYKCGTCNWTGQLLSLQVWPLQLDRSVIIPTSVATGQVSIIHTSAAPATGQVRSYPYKCGTCNWTGQLLSLQVCHQQLDRSVVIPKSVAPATGQVSCYPYKCGTCNWTGHLLSLQVWHLQLDRSVIIPASVAPATGQVSYYPYKCGNRTGQYYPYKCGTCNWTGQKLSLQVWHLQLDRSVVIPTSVSPATGQVSCYPYKQCFGSIFI